MNKVYLFIKRLNVLDLLIDIDCGSLVAPDNGFVNVPSTNFGSTALYQCNNGFILIGDRTRVCQRSGSWSGTNPVCQGIYVESSFNYF